MDVYFLGTGAGVPSPRRNVSALALRLDGPRGGIWLFDCGEGTQHQVLASPLKLSRLEKVFITHLHGDHIFGLPGLLATRSSQTDAPLTLYGPPGLCAFVRDALAASGTWLAYPMEVMEIKEGMVCQDASYRVEAARLDHGVPCFGYRITEQERPGRLRVEDLARLGVPPGPVYGRLKRGERIELPDGRTLDGRDLVDPPRPGRAVAVLGDTRPCTASMDLARGADLLVHEATFADAHADLAHRYGHSTARQAALIARAAGAMNLVLTHISPRYDAEDEPRLLAEAAAVFCPVSLALDHSVHDVPEQGVPAAGACDDSGCRPRADRGEPCAGTFSSGTCSSGK
ncbi:ribonuclease Z [Alicyclobacillus cellulosilyticus]|uniref:Ribonuclease Z n=1 Tax=Alicyclobacillus cellulosilyticus TaxID=1003997 RepID=A0A917K3H5_9BACL|nr:ribonuclease Z [Alicyclobacillus cellulosilyticus]GGI98620.1 ribonuclease Z [Alicyclobacillus cellulosilyticus]